MNQDTSIISRISFLGYWEWRWESIFLR